MKCYIIPPYITDQLPLPDRPLDVAHDAYIRRVRTALITDRKLSTDPVAVYDAGHKQSVSSRTPLVDADSNAIKAGLNAAEALWQLVGVSVLPCVGFGHYGLHYDNAFWDGAEMCFGDGDGRYFGDFASPVDVCVHERTHGVTGNRLDYQGQAGALNESMSDIAGIVAKQRVYSLPIGARNSWLIGEGLLLESGARALRDMLAPGTAYDTPALGQDPQPSDMDSYVHTSSDNGGVHTNSSIPSRAFAIASIAASDAEAIFKVWADVLLNGSYPTDCTFEQWAQLTVDRGGSHADVIASAWGVVKVNVVRPAPAPTPTPSTPESDLVVALKRFLKRGLLVPAYLRRAAQAWLDSL